MKTQWEAQRGWIWQCLTLPTAWLLDTLTKLEATKLAMANKLAAFTQRDANFESTLFT